MRKSVVKLDLHRKTASAKVGFGRNIVTNMTANIATFATPLPSLADVTDATDALETAYTEALDGGLSKTAAKNAAEDVFDTLLTALGNYVDSVAQGDETIILSSGMEVKRQPAPIGIPAQVTSFSAKTGTITGEIVLDWSKVYGAAIYLIYMKANDGDAFTLAGESTKSKFTVTGLNSAQRYWFKAVAVGSAGAGPESDVSTCLAF
jgi:hypothetical protein